MPDKHILHMLSPLKHMSPFDANMAVDAGFDAVLPYTNVECGDVTGLVQDAIFSRSPKLAVKTGVFIGGKDALLALDMLDAAKKALVPPFIISLFADPAGSFTTAAAMVACTEQVLRKNFNRDLKGARVMVFGATGVVGFASAVIAALEGAQVTLVGHDGPDRVRRSAAEIGKRFGTSAQGEDGSTEELKTKLLRNADVAFCAAKAGVRVLSKQELENAPNLLVAADVNAVPPSGIEGLDVQAKEAPLGKQARGIGALAIGNVKYQTEFGLFRRMIETDKPVAFDFRDAFQFARELARK
jgi:methylene-tetrahydromethanopterin dehydrogenase